MKSFGNLSILVIVLMSILATILFSRVECRPTISDDVIYPLMRTATAWKFILDDTKQAIKTTKKIGIRGPTFGPIYE